MEIEIVRPEEIEKRSFAIISEELKVQGMTLPEDQEAVTKRCIHTSADFDYARNLTFSEGAVEKAKEAIRHGASIVTDTQMARSGINKRVLEQYGGQVYCFMSDTDVAEAAKRAGTTRAVASMEKACALEEDLIFAIGNAPTALIRLYRRSGRVRQRGAVQGADPDLKGYALHRGPGKKGRQQYCSLHLQRLTVSMLKYLEG